MGVRGSSEQAVFITTSLFSKYFWLLSHTRIKRFRVFRVHVLGQLKENAALNEFSSRHTNSIIRLSGWASSEPRAQVPHWSGSRAVHWSLTDTFSSSSWEVHVYDWETSLIYRPESRTGNYFFLSQRRYAWWEFLRLFSVSRAVIFILFLSGSPMNTSLCTLATFINFIKMFYCAFWVNDKHFIFLSQNIFITRFVLPTLLNLILFTT